jgi:hypothetical protein
MSFIFALGLGALGLLGTLATAIAVALVTTEARGSIPVVCRRLLDRTAERLPPEQRHRREEWESDLADAGDRPLSQLAIALRIYMDGRAIAREAVVGIAEEAGKNGNGWRGVGLAVAARVLGPVRRRSNAARGILKFTMSIVAIMVSLLLGLSVLAASRNNLSLLSLLVLAGAAAWAVILRSRSR